MITPFCKMALLSIDGEQKFRMVLCFPTIFIILFWIILWRIFVGHVYSYMPATAIKIMIHYILQ